MLQELICLWMVDGQPKGWCNHMTILNEKFVLYNLDAHSLRGHHFYKSIVDFRAKILPVQKHRILNKDQY